MRNHVKAAPSIRFKGFAEDWEQRKLEEDISVVGGATPSKSNPDYWNGPIVWLSSQEIKEKYVSQGTYTITKKAVDDNTTKMVKAGTPLIVSRSGILARLFPISIPTTDVAINQDIKALIFDLNIINTNFFVAQLQKNEDFILRSIVKTGTTVQSINMPDFYKLQLSFPSMNEQEKVGKFFQRLDDTIALHQRKLEKTKALKSAYLSELFPVEGERKPKRRFAGFIDDWKQGTVGEYGYFYYGKSAPKWSVTKDAIIPCVRYGELYTKFGAKIDKVYSYTNISKENLKFSTGNEVLVPRVGEDPLDFANCSWLSIPNVAIGEMISVYNTEENPLFISYYFNSQLRHAFAKRVEGGNVSNLYFTYLENITISIPNKEEQDTIANFLESLDSVVEHHQHKLEKLKNIKQAYLNELFV